MEDLKKLIYEMTLEEKAALCSGKDFWHLQGVERLGIPSIMLTDGPHGLRKQETSADHLGIGNSVPSTCFPSGAAFASSYDRDLVHELGVTLGEECVAEDVAIVLGPAVNIKRSPLCGRNFEYLSEDPYLSSELAKMHIKGVQSKGIGTSIKHFAVNNQEHRRMTVDSQVDQRTLREIYLASFEGAVKEGKPETVMCAYNKVNGTYCSENEFLLTQVLRDEWGYEGIVVTDWGAVNDRVDGLKAGQDVEMPYSGSYTTEQIIKSVQDGTLSLDILDKTVERILRIIFQHTDTGKERTPYDQAKHHAIAKKIATESMVLLKNENKVLPLNKYINLAFIGEFAKRPRYQGGGSSHIHPTSLTSAWDAMEAKGIPVAYVQGFSIDKDEEEPALVEEALEAAKNMDAVVVFAGLPDRYESEGYDRTHLQMPCNQTSLIRALAEVNSRVIVVLHNGSPIEMSWLPSVQGVLEAYLSGQAVGAAVVDILFGDINPSGKLAETFPKKLSDNPSYLNFPGSNDTVVYAEGLFVGYRYYDKKEVDVLFPFGFGLSYTDFTYGNLKLDRMEMQDTEELAVSVDVKNTGQVFGKEVVQLYVAPKGGAVIRSVKELKGFSKLALQPGETKTATFTLDKRAFSYYNTTLKDWVVETGTYEIWIGRSSADIACTAEVQIQSTISIPLDINRNTTIDQLMADPSGQKLMGKIMAASGSNPSSMMEGGDDGMKEMMEKVFQHMPLRAMGIMSGNAITDEWIQEMLKEE